MKGLRVYLETTVFNYYFDENRLGHAETVRLFEAIRNGAMEAYTSIYALYEITNAPPDKQRKMLRLIENDEIRVVQNTDEVNRLVDSYIRNGLLSENHRLDCSHIAIASVYGLDCVLSFNFKHINKIRTKKFINLMNLKEGYKEIFICTPMEVLEDD
ncbi:MAG: PIN domain-containing protein [Synergistaceae bacterium]|jgi:predicted nucleic acid-binding protein|nr:PIN domain-containing protein [Synergistaceae bacterium]